MSNIIYIISLAWILRHKDNQIVNFLAKKAEKQIAPKPLFAVSPYTLREVIWEQMGLVGFAGIVRFWPYSIQKG